MAKYAAKLQEEELKLHVAEDWFSAYDCKRKIGKIDFCVDIPATELGLYDATPALKAAHKRLAAQIAPKVYEYGFLNPDVQLFADVG